VDLLPLLVVAAAFVGLQWLGKRYRNMKEERRMANEVEQKQEGPACGCGGGDCCGGPTKWIWIVLIVAVVGVLIAKNAGKKPDAESAAAGKNAPAVEASGQAKAIPRMVDLGATKCIPCKMMAPILEELKTTYAGKLDVEFIDVWESPEAGKKYGINVIPTQIFFDAAGKELFRHEGFFGREDILAKWKELGVDLAAKAAEPGVSRWTPAQPDPRAKDAICYLCDGDIPTKSLVVVKTEKGDVRLCGMHHYFVMYTSLTEDKAGFEKRVSVTDWATGVLVPISEASYVYGMEEKTGRPTVKAFADKAAAEKERQATGGNVLDLAVLQGKDIEVRERDRLTGEPVVVKTLNGSVASLEPATAVAWYGQRVKPDGTHASAGCFHQGFFTSAENLKKWVEANPLETGEEITIAKALADKMKLTPQQIGKACKIGECAPKW
jgi:thioredoxin 1